MATQEPGPSSATQPDDAHLLQQALDAVRVGAWNWDIRTGDLTWDKEMQLVLGIGPDVFDGRIETWRSLIHPDDLPVVLAQAEQALREGAEYNTKHRVRRPDGTVGWVAVRGRIVLGEDGAPARMVGRLWETTESLAALDSVGRALRHMSDGFLAVDADWRVLYVNGLAERLLGPSRELVGRTLWDIPQVSAPGLESGCRQAVADRRPDGAGSAVARRRPLVPPAAGPGARRPDGLHHRCHRAAAAGGRALAAADTRPPSAPPGSRS